MQRFRECPKCPISECLCRRMYKRLETSRVSEITDLRISARRIYTRPEHSSSRVRNIRFPNFCANGFSNARQMSRVSEMQYFRVFEATDAQTPVKFLECPKCPISESMRRRIYKRPGNSSIVRNARSSNLCADVCTDARKFPECPKCHISESLQRRIYTRPEDSSSSVRNARSPNLCADGFPNAWQIPRMSEKPYLRIFEATDAQTPVRFLECPKRMSQSLHRRMCSRKFLKCLKC